VARPRRPDHTPFPPDLADDLSAGADAVDPADLVPGALIEDARLDGVDLSGAEIKGCTLDGVHLRDVRLVGSVLSGWRLLDVVLERCDLAGATWGDAALTRVRFTDCRLAGFSLTAGTLEDFHIVGCTGESPSLFGSSGKRWLLDNSQLTELDARDVTVTGAGFEHCGLAGSQWAHARLTEVTFRESDLAGLGGAAGLRGATFDTVTLLGAAEALARHLGITLQDGSEPDGKSLPAGD